MPYCRAHMLIVKTGGGTQTIQAGAEGGPAPGDYNTPQMSEYHGEETTGTYDQGAQGGYDQGGYDQGGYDQGGYDQGYQESGYQEGGYDEQG